MVDFPKSEVSSKQKIDTELSCFLSGVQYVAGLRVWK
jgi:hypothetical protein